MDGSVGAENPFVCEKGERAMIGKSHLLVSSCLLVAMVSVPLRFAGLGLAPVGAANGDDAKVGAAAEWPSLGGGYDRSGLSPNEGLAEGVAAWAQETGQGSM